MALLHVGTELAGSAEAMAQAPRSHDRDGYLPDPAGRHGAYGGIMDIRDDRPTGLAYRNHRTVLPARCDFLRRSSNGYCRRLAAEGLSPGRLPDVQTF